MLVLVFYLHYSFYVKQSTQNYLKAIYHLSELEDKTIVKVNDVSKKLNISIVLGNVFWWDRVYSFDRFWYVLSGFCLAMVVMFWHCLKSDVLVPDQICSQHCFSCYHFLAHVFGLFGFGCYFYCFSTPDYIYHREGLRCHTNCSKEWNITSELVLIILKCN